MTKLREDHPRLRAPEYHAERNTIPDNEEEIRWVGVFVGLIGAVLMTLSFLLDSSFF